MASRITTTLLALLALSACSSEPASAPAAAAVQAPTSLPPHTLLEADNASRVRTYRVRLEKTSTEAEIAAVAKDIQRRLSASDRPAKVFFYLPGQDAGGIAWALARLDGDQVVVELQGPSAGEIAATPAPATVGEIVGTWDSVTPMTGARIAIIKRGDEYVVENRDHGAGGTPSIKAVVRGNGKAQNQYADAAGDGTDPIVYVVLPSGDLEVRFGDGQVFMTAKAVR